MVNNVLEGQAHPVVIDIEAASQLSVAMVENFVPLVARISLTSNAAHSDLTVELALLPDFSAKWTAHVSSIPPGGTSTSMPSSCRSTVPRRRRRWPSPSVAMRS